MANANYYGSLFKSNGTASVAPTVFDTTLPAGSKRGVKLLATGSIAFTAAIATTDVLYLARVPAGHRVTSIVVRAPVLDSSTTLTVNIGTSCSDSTYTDADAYAAASTAFQSSAVGALRLPGQSAINGPTTWYTGPGAAGTPTSAYNVLFVAAAGPSTATSGTIYYEIEYTPDVAVYDDNNSPAVTTS